MKLNKIFSAFAGVLVLLATVIGALAVNCYWETESPNIERGFARAVGYGNDSGFRYYPITDMVSARQVLLRNTILGIYENKNLNATTIKVVEEPNRTSYDYFSDLAMFEKIGCSIPERKRIYDSGKFSKDKKSCERVCVPWQLCWPFVGCGQTHYFCYNVCK